MKPRITIEDHYCKGAAINFQHSWIWRVTLPNGKSRFAGAVKLFTIDEVIGCRKLQRWVKANA